MRQLRHRKVKYKIFARELHSLGEGRGKFSISTRDGGLTNSELLETTLSGDASCKDFPNTVFLASDLSNIKLDFANISGAKFEKGGIHSDNERRRSNAWMSLEYSSEDPKFSGLAAEWLERRSFIDSELDEKMDLLLS